MLIPLSYPMTMDMPLYPGIKGMKIQPDKCKLNGDSSNTHVLQFSNHSSTHIDTPLHFCDDKQSVSDLLLTQSVFSPAYCINISKSAGQPVLKEDFLGFLPWIRNAEAVLIRTGFFQCRNKDPQVYATNPPWIDPAVPALLHTECPHLRVFGIDTISISNPNNREAGRECHRSFLCDDNAIMLIEDMDLSSEKILQTDFTLNVFPWVLEHLDGIQVIVLAETY